VRLRYVGTFGDLLSLDALREQFSVEELPVVRNGNRLSILPVPEASAQRLFELLGPL
jgi:predicted RNA-binding protein with PUA-like domain